MSQSTGPLSATSARIIAVHLKSANKKIFRALMGMASAALLVRVFGMVNQIIVTQRFGAGAIMDAYFVASALPTLIASLGTSAIESSVIPVYAKVRTRGKEQASILFSTLMNILLLISALLTAFLFTFRRQLIFLSAPALDPFRAQLAVNLTPFILPALLLMMGIGLLEYILNAEGQFGWPAYITGGLMTAAFGILMMPWKLYADAAAYIFTWLIGYSSLMGAVGGILISDYWLLRRRRLDLPALFDLRGRYAYRGGVNWRAMVALVIAVVPVLPGFIHAASTPGGQVVNPTLLDSLYTYAWFVTFAISSVVYLALMASTHLTL